MFRRTSSALKWQILFHYPLPTKTVSSFVGFVLLRLWYNKRASGKLLTKEWSLAFLCSSGLLVSFTENKGAKPEMCCKTLLELFVTAWHHRWCMGCRERDLRGAVLFLGGYWCHGSITWVLFARLKCYAYGLLRAYIYKSWLIAGMSAYIIF